ncbi:MAG: spermidine/putrescine ABC transporter substrate-binding protein [Dehalococcoidia bacterium]|nr:spermidine/putrescine ABC transporter substrate-binding protein [Dehalococcoidia bacterium]
MRLKWLISVGLVICLVMAFALPMCAPAPAPPVEEEVGPYEKYVSSLSEGEYPVPRDCFEQAMEEGQLNIYDWAEWWPEEIYEGFSQEFGIKIVKDNFADYGEVVAKFKVNPETEYDYVRNDPKAFLELKGLGVLQELNHEWIPNVNKYLSEVGREVSYNRNYEYAVTTDISPTNYGYNTKYVDDPRIPSWSVLFEPDEKYKGRITMLNDMYEVIGGALKYLGYSWNSDDEEELMEAKELLLRQKPYVMAYDSWPVRLVLEEEAWIAQSWHGDILFLRSELETFVPALPTEGSVMIYGFLVIPKGSPHPAAAHLWINYLFRPRVNAFLFEAICYPPTHTTAGELLSPELREWLPPEEYWEMCDDISLKPFTGKGLELRSQIWEELMG